MQRLVGPPDLLASLKPDRDVLVSTEYATPPFRTEQLVAHLKREILGLRNEPDPEVRLPGLQVSEHVFIEGTYAPNFLDNS